MLSCAILDDYQDAALPRVDQGRLAGRVRFVAFHDHVDDLDAVAERLKGFEIVVAMRERTPFGAALIERLPDLELLITTGMRNASIDLKAAAARGVTVCGTPSCVGSAAELSWGLLLAIARHIPAENAGFRRGGPWQISVGRDLAGLTLGVIGLGTLGSRVVAYGKAFGMRVLGWSRSNTPERSAELGAGFAPDIETLLRESDVVSIHVTLNEGTRGLLGAERLALMKPSAILVNTSRGPIVEEAAVIEALTDRRIQAYGVDVFDREPLPADHPFRRLDNVLATPHLGYVTENSYEAYFTGVVEDIEAWMAGAPVRRLG